jgi:glutamyl-tRNA synthetase
MLDGAAVVLADCPWETEAIKDAVAAVGEGLGIKLGKAQAPIRVALTGRTVGPPIFETMALCFDRQVVLDRIAQARLRL